MSPCTWLLARGLNPRMYICMHIKVKKKEFHSGRELARAKKVAEIGRGSSALPTTLWGHC